MHLLTNSDKQLVEVKRQSAELLLDYGVPWVIRAAFTNEQSIQSGREAWNSSGVGAV